MILSIIFFRDLSEGEQKGINRKLRNSDFSIDWRDSQSLDLDYSGELEKIGEIIELFPNFPASYGLSIN